MIKDILFEKEVITKTNHMYRDITTEFMKYERYRKARAMANMSIQKECFCCEEPFEEDENLSLLFNGNQLNVLCCEKCSNKLINDEEEQRNITKI